MSEQAPMKLPAGSPEKKPATPPENKGNGPPAPDFEAAAKLIKDDIATLSTRTSKANGDKSAAWKRVQDDCHVNKGAAKAAANLSTLSDEMQSEWLRSFFGLLKPLGIGVRRDLVDIAEGVEGLMIPLKDAPTSELETT